MILLANGLRFSSIYISVKLAVYLFIKWSLPVFALYGCTRELALNSR